MLESEQVVLAILTGAGFGVLVHIMGSSWQRLAVMLTLLWTMQTAPQFIYRALDGTDVSQEVINVTILRVAFAVTACLVLALWRRWEGRA